MTQKQKLELTWIGKDKQPQLEPRILVEDAGKSYGDRKANLSACLPERVRSQSGGHAQAGRACGAAGNMLVHGDNLLALKALEQDFAGKIKCVFIDPPYNTGSAFEHYDDGVEHSLWLSLMRDRLVLLRKLLSNDGSLWITIDDNEAHYLKVLCDAIFARNNFVANVVWQKKFSPQNDAKWLSDMHDHILVYAKDKTVWRPNRIPVDSKASENRKNIDNDPRGPWISVDYTCNKSKSERPNLYYPIKNPNTGEEMWPKETAAWRFSEERHLENVKNKLVYWGKNGANRVPRFKNFKGILTEGQIPATVWLHQDVGNNQEARKESLQFNSSDPFSTPKPERLLQRIAQIASNETDIVLDSFAGSGTTGAVAHKMGRRWIMVELGEHCETHCLPRLKKVCDGTDQGGISEAVGWKGGGGFKYYELAPSLLKKDKYGNWVISEEYNANMLAAAMAKHEGFKYSPDAEVYWKHGKSSEKDYIFTTTAFVQVAFIDRIHEEMAEDEHLLICCKKFSSACKGRFPNIEIKKIPAMLLGRCEFGREDYSLNIVNMPHDPDEPDFVPAGPPKVKAKAKDDPAQQSLFGNEEDI